MSSPINPLIQIVSSLGLGAGNSLANALQAQGNPIAYQLMQENARQQALINQQNQARNSLTAFEKESLARQDEASDSASIHQAMMDRFNALKAGFTPTQDAGDITIGGTNYKAPTPDATFTISKDSDLGKFLQTTSDITGLTGPQYIQASQNFALHNQAQKDEQLSQAALTQEKAAAHQWVDQRLVPSYAQGLYGAPDSTLASEKTALHNQIDAIQDLKGMPGFWERTRNYETPGEAELRKKKQDNRFSKPCRSWDRLRCPSSKGGRVNQSLPPIPLENRPPLNSFWRQ